MLPQESWDQFRTNFEAWSRRLHAQSQVTTVEPAGSAAASTRPILRTAADAALDRAAELSGDQRLQALRIVHGCHPQSDRALVMLLQGLSGDPTAARRDEARTAVERWLAVRGIGDLRVLERVPVHLLELALSGRPGHAATPSQQTGDPALLERYVDDDRVELIRDLRDVSQQPVAAEQARRLHNLATAKYPHDRDVCVYLGRAAIAAGQHVLAREAIDLALVRTRRPRLPHQLDQLHELAQHLEPLSLRTAALEAILAVDPAHGPSLYSRIIDLVDVDDMMPARSLLERGCADPEFWSRLPERTRDAFARRARPVAAPDGPRFSDGTYYVTRLVHASPRQRLYDAIAADGRLVTLRTLLGHDPALLHDVLLDLQTSRRTTSLVVPQRAIARAADGTPYQVFDRIHGQVFASLHTTPTRDPDSAIDVVWYATLAVAEVHRHGHVLALTADDVIVLDANHEQRIAFLDNGFHHRFQAGKTPLLTGDPLPLQLDRGVDQCHRDLYGLGGLLHQVFAGQPPPSPYHERNLVSLPEGEPGARIRSVLAELLDPRVVPYWGNAGKLADALDRLHVWTPPELHPGARLGPWILHELFDSDGGVAELWHGSSTTHGHVAVKVLRPEQQRMRSARHALALEVANMPVHDGLPRVIDDGRLVAPSGQLAFYAMELLSGESLHRALVRGPLPIDAVVTMSCQLADVLLTVHRHGIVHGDVKPANVFLERARYAGGLRWDVLKLLDFGSSRTIAPDRFGRVHAFVSPATSAPEQWTPAPPTPATDVYSFGTLIHEAFTGLTPFPAGTEVEARHAHTRPLPDHPRYDELPELRVLVRAMCEKRPEQRMALVDVRIELLRIAAALRLPFLQVTRGRMIDVEPVMPVVTQLRMPPEAEPQAELEAQTILPPVEPPMPPAPHVAPIEPRPLAPWLAAGASVVLFACALVYYLGSGAQP